MTFASISTNSIRVCCIHHSCLVLAGRMLVTLVLATAGYVLDASISVIQSALCLLIRTDRVTLLCEGRHTEHLHRMEISM